jgi:signal transduction histidine kinase
MRIGTDGGLNQFDRQREAFRVVPTEPGSPGAARVESIGSILEDRQGDLWLSTWGDGLKRLERETGQFVAYRHEADDPGSLKTNFVIALHEDAQGRIWVGTDGGLHLFEPAENAFRFYGLENGLQSEEIMAILEDQKGDLWIATGVGLSQFDPNSDMLRNYDSGDGLQARGYSTAAFNRGNGQMLFGGMDGIDVFYPERILPNPYVPPVALVSLQQGGQPVELDQALENVTSLSFSWPRNDFEFEFAALSYTQPDQNRYAYKLEGYDQDWNYIGQERVGHYSSLPGGTYTLRLRGSNDDGVWNEEGLAIQVTVVPPIWQTWWFVGIVAVVLAGSVIGGYRLRIRGIEARSRELEAQVEERTAELSKINLLLSREIIERQRAEEALAQRAAEAAVVQERSRLARELHDAVTQTLFSASLIAEALPELWEGDPEEGQQLLKELRQLSRGALAEMRTLLLELRPAALVETNLGDLLRQLGEAVAGRTGIPVKVVVESCQEPVDRAPSLPSDVHVSLYRIAQEALNNVVKHADAAEVEISLYCTFTQEGEGRGEAVVLFISDDGRGFNPDSVPSDRLGLGIIRERAEAIGARLKIESELGQGTQVLVVWIGKPSREST